MRQLALDITVSPAPTFGNFIAGRNAEAIAHLRAAAAGAGERFVYLWGEAGCGRTHLLRAAALAAGAGAFYVACRANSVFDDAAPLLAADDVERLGSDAQVMLFHRYNALRELGGSLIVSGSVPPVQLKLRADLLTRLGWGLVVQVHALSDDEKIQALKQHARERGFALPEEVCSYLLAHVPRDMGSLFATLAALDRYALQAKRAVTLPLLRDLLRRDK